MAISKKQSSGLLSKTFYKSFSLGALKPHVDTLLPHLDKTGGRFVEVGSRDGMKESFTPFLEKAQGWEGVLIEPWPHLFKRCRKNRKASLSLNVAAVDERLHDSYIQIEGLPPAASIRNRLRQELDERENGAPLKPPPVGKAKPRILNYVTTSRLSAILDKAKMDKDFDLMVLNLIGYEANALVGMDFERYQPTYILIRTIDDTLLLPHLPHCYQPIARSRHDRATHAYLFRYADFGAN